MHEPVTWNDVNLVNLTENPILLINAATSNSTDVLPDASSPVATRAQMLRYFKYVNYTKPMQYGRLIQRRTIRINEKKENDRGHGEIIKQGYKYAYNAFIQNYLHT